MHVYLPFFFFNCLVFFTIGSIVTRYPLICDIVVIWMNECFISHFREQGRAKDTRGERNRKCNLDFRHREEHSKCTSKVISLLSFRCNRCEFPYVCRQLFYPCVLLCLRCVLPRVCRNRVRPHRVFHRGYLLGWLLPPPYNRCSFCYSWALLLHSTFAARSLLFIPSSFRACPSPTPRSQRVPGGFPTKFIPAF